MPTNATITKRYYPALSEVISTDDLPEFLNFAAEGLEGLLSKIHYKNLQYSRSLRGDSAFYSLDIVANNIGLPLPFGLRLVLNPDEDGDSDISSFPISLQYQWEMLAYLRAFKAQNFAFTPQAFYELGLQIFKLSDGEVIAHIINEFMEPGNGVQVKFDQLVADINAMYPSANLDLPLGQPPTANLLAGLIRANEGIPDTVPTVMFSLYIAEIDLDATRQNLQHFYQIVMPSGIEDYIRRLITPRVRATLTLSAGIEFPTTILQPVLADGTPIPDRKTVFRFIEATFYADTQGGIGSEIELAGSLMPQYSQIGRTGFLIEFDRAKLDISRKRNIPEADLAGYDPDFVGLYVGRASVRYLGLGSEDTQQSSIALVADNLLIGTGGISGSISMETEGLLYRQFGNFAAELNRFSVTFQKGRISRSDIAGRLTIGGFRQGSEAAVIDIEAHVQDNGDFMLSARPQDGYYTITLPQVLQIHIRSLRLGREQRGYYVEVSGKLDFIADIPGLGAILPTSIDIQRFRIWDNGDLEFTGGTFILPKTFRLKVGPVNMEVTQISFGPYARKLHGVERKYRYFGFDGMINTGRAGVSATGNGIKYYFTTDHNSTDKPFDSFTSIEAIAVDMTIPGNASPEKAAFILNGYLSMRNPDPGIAGSSAGVEYTGAVNFALPRIRLAGSGAMHLNPKIPAFLVDVGMELPVPVPMGPTGLGIYGFRGLFGQHYLPSKSATVPPLDESATWWEYYKARSRITDREGIEVDKFESRPGFSVGAGISLATAYDKGFTFSSKLFLMLGLPDVFLLQGQAGILRSRVGLTSDIDPPFSALIAIDNRSFMTGLGVNYRLPEGGNFDGGILKIAGKMELAFFFNNASGWYINLGKDQPENERIQARILSLFNGYAYMMVSSRGLRVGAGARFDFNKKFGPVAVGLGAFADLQGALSFRPIQLGGRIQFGGYAYLKIWKLKLGLAVTVVLGVESPNPFSIYGALMVSVKVLWKTIRFSLEVGWTFNKNSAPLFQPMDILRLPNESEGYMPVAAVNILSSGIFPVNYVTHELTGTVVVIPPPGAGTWRYDFNHPEDRKKVTVPLDSFIDIDLLKPVKPGNTSRLGGVANQLPDAYIEWVPAQKGISNQVTHELQFMGLDIFCWSDEGGGSWRPYHTHEAVTALAGENTSIPDLSKLKDGYWQFSEPNRYNKIRLLSQNMFTLASEHVSIAAEMDGLNYARQDLFCYESIRKAVSVHWMDEAPDTVYETGHSYFKDGFSFAFKAISGSVQQSSASGQYSLRIAGNGGKLEIELPEPLTYLELEWGTNNNSGTIAYYQYQYVPTMFGRTLKTEILVESETIPVLGETPSVVYDHLDRPIHKVVIDLSARKVLDFAGDLDIGGYFGLPPTMPNAPVHLYETRKTLANVALYNRHLLQQDVLQDDPSALSGAVGRWSVADRLDSIGNNHAIVANTPLRSVAFWRKQPDTRLQPQQAYTFISNADRMLVPYDPSLLVETGDFSVALTVVFNALETGVSTLLSKVETDPTNGDKKGYAIHLYRHTNANPDIDYRTQSVLPGYAVLFTSYGGQGFSTVQADADYVLDCDSGRIPPTQHVQVVVSVSRSADTLRIYLNRELKADAAVPSELDVAQNTPFATEITGLSYLSPSVHRRVSGNEMTRQGFIEENQLLHDNLNRTVQPVWRPETTYAVVVKVRDVVNNNVAGAVQKNFIYGFKTAGPIGHFQDQSTIYQELAGRDQGATFKLADLKHYIDYGRSFPDAQGRQDRSKPVFHGQARIGLVFTKPYINAMFADWDSYQGTPAINSSLQVRLIDPYGQEHASELTWEQLPDEPINDSNYKRLPADQQVIYLLNRAASDDGCNTSPVLISKKKRKGSYQFPALWPNRQYTAVFEAAYQPAGQMEARAEVHRFGFITSRFADFEAQASSFIRTGDDELAYFALHPILVYMDTQVLENTVLKIWNDGYESDDPEVLRYAFKYDRLLFGGLRQRNLQPFEHTVIQPIIHIDPATQDRRILALVVRNPEPFNNPNLGEEQLQDTVLAGTLAEGVFEADPAIIGLHARDTSAVVLSNAQMNLPSGDVVIQFKHKLFNGADYDTDSELYTTPTIHIEATPSVQPNI